MPRRNSRQDRRGVLILGAGHTIRPEPMLPEERPNMSRIDDIRADLAPEVQGPGCENCNEHVLLAEVDRLTKERDDMHRRLVVMDHDRAGLSADLEAANDRATVLEIALMWYADPANHDRGPNMIPAYPTLVMADKGERARRALVGEGDG